MKSNGSGVPTAAQHAGETRGWLFVQGNVVRTWRRRYFVLRGSAIHSFASPTDTSPSSVAALSTAAPPRVVSSSASPLSFDVDTRSDGVLHLRAESEADFRAWIDALSRATSLSPQTSSLASPLSSPIMAPVPAPGNIAAAVPVAPSASPSLPGSSSRTATITVAGGMCCERCEAKVAAVLNRTVGSGMWSSDKRNETVTLTATGSCDVRSVVDALVDSGYFANMV